MTNTNIFSVICNFVLPVAMHHRRNAGGKGFLIILQGMLDELRGVPMPACEGEEAPRRRRSCCRRRAPCAAPGTDQAAWPPRRCTGCRGARSRGSSPPRSAPPGGGGGRDSRCRSSAAWQRRRGPR